MLGWAKPWGGRDSNKARQEDGTADYVNVFVRSCVMCVVGIISDQYPHSCVNMACFEWQLQYKILYRSNKLNEHISSKNV